MSTSDIADELLKIKELLEKGILSKHYVNEISISYKFLALITALFLYKFKEK